MNILKGNILKGFAAVAMLCMTGTVLAESVAVGDIGAYYFYKSQTENAAAASGSGLTTVKTGEKTYER